MSANNDLVRTITRMGNPEEFGTVIARNLGSEKMMHCGCRTNITFKELPSFDFDTLPVYEYTGKML